MCSFNMMTFLNKQPQPLLLNPNSAWSPFPSPASVTMT